VCGRKELPFAGYSVVKDVIASGDDCRPMVQAREIVRLKVAACICEPNLKSGGEYRARTGDLLVANQALSQLS